MSKILYNIAKLKVVAGLGLSPALLANSSNVGERNRQIPIAIGRVMIQ
jgi:hypothetical protein